MTDRIIVLGIVFVSVALLIAVFLPIFFSAKDKSKDNENDATLMDDPVRRFVDPDDLIKMQCTLGMITVSVGAALILAFNFYWGVPLAALAGFVAYQLPHWIVARKIAKRNEEFESGMFDFTIFIANTLRAGVALPSAIEMALQSVGGPIREEFSTVLREHRLGIDLAESIERLSKRVTSENLQLFSATVCITMKTGGSMAEVLDHVVATMRQRTSFQDKLKTMIAQAEFESFAVSLSPLAAFVILYLLNDKLMKPMLTDPLGWAAICLVIFLEAIGFIVLKKTVSIKY